jgi:hypothetical protein
VSLETDSLLSSHATCPRLTELVEDVFNSPEVQKIDEKYRWLYDYLEENVGQDVKHMNQGRDSPIVKHYS